jgi:hypothetical protein
MAREFADGAHVAVAAIPRTRECDADCDIDDILTRARDMARAEFDTDDMPDSERLELYWRAARARMRIGYRKAARKYRDVNVCALFWRIADAVGRVARHVDYVGAEFRLTYDARTLSVRVDDVYSED